MTTFKHIQGPTEQEQYMNSVKNNNEFRLRANHLTKKQLNQYLHSTSYVVNNFVDNLNDEFQLKRHIKMLEKRHTL